MSSFDTFLTREAGFAKLELTLAANRSSHDNSRFASCGGDRSVFLWDVTSGDIVRRLSGHTGKVNAVAWNADSSVLASGALLSSLAGETRSDPLSPPRRLFRHFRPVMGHQVSPLDITQLVCCQLVDSLRSQVAKSCAAADSRGRSRFDNVDTDSRPSHLYGER